MTFTTGQPTTRQSTVGWKKGPVVPADLTGMSHYDGVRIFPMQGGGTMTAGLQWVDKKPVSGEAPSRMSEIGANPFSGALHAYNGFTIPYPEESTKFSVAMSEYCMRHVEWVVKPNPNGVASRFETLAYEQLYTIDRNWDGIKCQERTAPLERPGNENGENDITADWDWIVRTEDKPDEADKTEQGTAKSEGGLSRWGKREQIVEEGAK